MLHDVVKDYYGNTLEGSCDLKTDACSTLEMPTREIRGALSNIHDEVSSRYYGCGIAIPTSLEGLKVLDLGSGAGRDVYALAQLVGPNGHVTGVDMTPEQLDVARKHENWHAEKFGYDKPNTRFLEGYLEKLDDLDLEKGSFDLIISNCVFNLCVDKPAVFKSAFDLLKDGGEVYFSDVYSDRRIPDHLVDDEVLYGECLSGALYWDDYIQIVKNAGFLDPRVFDHRPLSIIDQKVKDKIDPIKFASVTARLMKLKNADAGCEDYGQAVIYKGGIQGMERAFKLDTGHEIEAGRVFPVCGNTLAMLTETRFAPHFEVLGEGKTHLGPFPNCKAPAIFENVVTDTASSTDTGSSCC